MTSARGFGTLLRMRAGEAVARASVPELSWPDFARALLDGTAGGLRVAAYFGARADGVSRLYQVLADDAGSELAVGATRLAAAGFPSLTPQRPQLHVFEREIAEQLAVVPAGHPWLKPLRFAPPLPGIDPAASGEAVAAPLPGVTDFYRVEGEEIHEVGVGPVHAGVIEPGHFRFQCHGEHVLHLEIALGYQHRGVERALLGGPDARTIHYLETAAGDTTIGHASAYCQVVEALAGAPPAPRGAALRDVALELERLANHTGDLGALAGDVGYLPTASYCGRIRGDFLNLTAELCGSRLGRGLARPGGAAFDADQRLASVLAERLARAAEDCRSGIELLWDTPSVMERFEGTGGVPREVAESLGLRGPAARASGIDRDVRRDHPTAAQRARPIAVALGESGDVFARAWVRWLEIERSIAFLREALRALPAGPARNAIGPPGPERLAVALVESWRGEICHVAWTDRAGRFERYKVIDASFHNWSALAFALRGQQISDFPLCNKSFNLSYCGHDL